MNPYIILYKTLLSRRYHDYLRRAGGNVDKCHEALLHGTYFEEYDYYHFDQKSPAERRTYVTDAWRNRICRRINNPRQQAVIMDKYRTAVHFHDYYRRQYMRVSSADDRAEFVRFGMAEGRLVVKPTNDCAGRGVRLITAQTQSQWNAHFDSLLADNRPYIVEQLILQDPAMALWNASSVNTIRINTLLRKGRVSLLTANIRVGRPGAFVDNCAQGGLCANIDPATGVIITTACGHDESRFTHHPDSHIPFVGTAIPRWPELVSIAEAMARMLPKLTYCSWDYALTPQGWALVEANKGELIADQRNLGRGLRQEFLSR